MRRVNFVLRWFLALAIFSAFYRPAYAERWPTTWISTELASHPLVGKIYAPHSKTMLTPAAYLEALGRADFVLLGEYHDNAYHHVLQGLVVRHLRPKLRAVVFEHFNSDQQIVLDAFRTGKPRTGPADGDDASERLFLVTGWDQSGWPERALYRPLIAAVIDGDAKIIAGNVPRARMFEVARQGSSALSADARRAMLLDRPLGGDLEEALLNELEASHCGLMPKEAFGNMAVAQRFRDGHMAAAMVEAAAGGGQVVLVAGNGHVRRDRGVPWYLERTAKGAVPISIGHVEVSADRLAPEDYAEAMASYSYVVFTPRPAREDPCIAMRQRFEKRQKK